MEGRQEEILNDVQSDGLGLCGESGVDFGSTKCTTLLKTPYSIVIHIFLSSYHICSVDREDDVLKLCAEL